ncbi:alpha/beta hydrolase [Micromonospora sp. WMMD882]|uniref:alpha/beta fold hydrolase n=1 Tax=Micromonospora sp. WMMD882 TaxID=3015151 RepID=UPI00248D20E8|nr:alpha/beta hydrolase [Micromonospora sp. WMMD882]WBB80407.1 alpha/beta hydrolase [Micromonospora sp. WMMD882]
MNTSRRTLIAGSAAVAAGALLGPAQAAAIPPPPPYRASGPTIVLVHGAFADASGWTEVVRILQRDGHRVIAPANPLRSVSADSAYLASVLTTVDGPLVLVGHSYGGMVITNAAVGNPRVKSLVYVAAFAPEQGETVQELQLKYPGSKLGEAALDFRPYPTADGAGSVDGYVKPEAFREVFAADLPRATTDVMAATQRPGDVHTLGEPSGPPAWRSVPSWYLVARQDNLIPADAQRFMARRAGAQTREVDASHVAMISQPRVTADVIRRAAR